MNLSALLPRRLRQAAAELVASQKFRFLVVGSINTVFGYALGVSLYLVLSPYLHIIWIGVIGNVLAITFSFTTQKLLVFQTQGHWLLEYLRSYAVYGGTAVFGIILLWVLVDGVHLSIWIAQGLSLVIKVAIMYFGHLKFTFRVREPAAPETLK